MRPTLAKFAPLMELPELPEAPFLVTHQFFAPGNKSVVQIGPRGITVNTSAYPGFEQFRSAIAKVLETYIALAKPTSVFRLGLRYL